jgi:hypothetical protein
MIIKRYFLPLLLFHAIIQLINAAVLPIDFQVQVGSSGPELVWTSHDKNTIPIGDARPEFRIGKTGNLLGYPVQNIQQGKLVLPISRNVKLLLDSYSNSLEVWLSGRRIDREAPVPDSASSILPNITQTPTVPVDPTKRGSFAINRTSYDMGNLNYSKYPFSDSSIEVLAEVTYPVPFPTTKCPFVLFLHGRHSICYIGGPNGETAWEQWPCQDGYKPIPSHLGYRYVADILASNGYIVISISANGITARDGGAYDAGADARSNLIRHHLHLWSKWNSVKSDPWNGMVYGKVNMKKVVLVGHSRGGEGVNIAAIDTQVSDP